MLVDQHVADMYVGDFIERAFRSPQNPSVALMKNRMCDFVEYSKSLGRCRAFEKKDFGRLVQTLRADVLANGSQVN